MKNNESEEEKKRFAALHQVFFNDRPTELNANICCYVRSCIFVAFDGDVRIYARRHTHTRIQYVRYVFHGVGFECEFLINWFTEKFDLKIYMFLTRLWLFWNEKSNKACCFNWNEIHIHARTQKSWWSILLLASCYVTQMMRKVHTVSIDW